MTKISVIVILALTAAISFGLGYRTGYVPPVQLELKPLPAQSPIEDLEPVARQVADALQIVEPLERAHKLAGLLGTLGPESIVAVRTGYDTVFLDLNDLELRLLAQWWARHDPHSAFRWTLGNWQGSSMQIEVLRAWAARDPQAAKASLTLLKTHPGHMRNCVQAVAVGWDESGQPGLGEFIRDMGPGTARQKLISPITRRRVLRDGVEATTAWLESLPDDDPPDRFKLQCYRRVATAITAMDPEQGAAWAAEQGEGEYGRGLYRRVATRWAVKDGPATMAWLETLPAGEERDSAVREGFSFWARTRNTEAHAWIAAEPVATWNEPARAIHAGKVFRTDRAAGLAMAEALEHPELREDTLGKIAKAWYAVDPEAAEAWIETSDLSEIVKARAMKGRPERKRAPRANREPGDDEALGEAEAL